MAPQDMPSYGSFPEDVGETRRGNKWIRVGWTFGVLAFVGVVGLWTTSEPTSTAANVDLQLPEDQHYCPAWPSYCHEHDNCLTKFHDGDVSQAVPADKCEEYVQDCMLYCRECACTKPENLYCEAFGKSCQDPGHYIMQEVPKVCFEVEARGEGCDHQDRECDHSCGCATIRNTESGFTYANWDHAQYVDYGNADRPHRGIVVVSFDEHTLKETNEDFFYYAHSGVFANDERADISNLAQYLNDIPVGRLVSVATNDEPFGEWAIYQDDIHPALSSMGIPPPPNNPEWRGAYVGFGKAGCAEFDNCPSWANSDYQARYTQAASLTARICADVGDNVDANGCYTRAGYTWCEALNSCVQNWNGGDGGPCIRLDSEAACVQVEAIGEGCNHGNKECTSCGCAIVRRVEQAQDGTQTGVNYDHANGYRGTAVAVIDPATLTIKSQSFARYTEMQNLIDNLNAVTAGDFVAVMTNDEPFQHWRGDSQTNVNNALLAMGIPPPPNNPEWRGAFVGFGKAGCVDAGDCPDWADSDYRSRYSSSAILEKTICAGCDEMDSDKKYDLVAFDTKFGVADAVACASLCNEDVDCYSFSFNKDSAVEEYQRCYFYTNLPTDEEKLDDACCESGVPACAEAKCVNARAVGEGCNHGDRKCGSCGCATLETSDVVAQPIDVKYDHGDNGRYYRGIAVVQLDALSLAVTDSTFISWNQIGSLTNHLNSVAHGTIVSIATNDEPFQYWRNNDQTNVNAALTAMGIPPPPHNPEYRGAFAGFGVAGCVSNGGCPSWANSQYQARYSSVARIEAAICPDIALGSCKPAGIFEPNECCPGGYEQIHDVTKCEQAFNSLSADTLSGATYGDTDFDDAENLRPSGCFVDEDANQVHFNPQDEVGKEGLLKGQDRVICGRRSGEGQMDYAKGGYAFLSPNPQCTFDVNGGSYDQDNSEYPSCPSDYVAFGEAGNGFCCLGNCEFVSDTYIYNATDMICAAKGNDDAVLYGETFDQCSDPDPTNKFCMWAMGPAWDANAVQGWKDYTIRANIAFTGEAAGIVFHMQNPQDERSPRYWLKFAKGDGGEVGAAVTYYDGEVEIPLSLGDVSVDYHSGYLASKPSEADLISNINAAIGYDEEATCLGDDGGCGGALVLGDGDCDSDSDCEGSMKCGTNNCGDFRSDAGWPYADSDTFDSTDDCCYEYKYCTVKDAELVGFKNQNMCPSGSREKIGWRFDVVLSSHVTGEWEFDFNVDFGWGGIVLFDGVESETGYKGDNMWWSGQYNRAIPLDMKVELTKGYHTMTIYGAEGCCDGTSEIRFKAPGAADWAILSKTNLEPYKVAEQSTRTFQEDTIYDVKIEVKGEKIDVRVDGEQLATYNLVQFDAASGYEPAFSGPGECLDSDGGNSGESSNLGPGLSLGECCALCDSDDACVAIDYDDGDGDCWTNENCDLQDTDHYSTWKKKEVRVDLGSGYGGFGFQTWKADMHAVNVEFLRSWSSDPALTECFPMEPQPTTPEDTDEFPLTAEIAQDICDEFSSVGCGGFLFMTRMAQQARTFEPVASVTYCTRGSLTFSAEPSESDPIGYFRDGSM